MRVAAVVLLDRSLPTSEHQTALEGGLLAELGQRFGYRLRQLARPFDHSVSWISARLALVEDTREAGPLCTAWRLGSPAIHKRILDDHELSFKTQRRR